MNRQPVISSDLANRIADKVETLGFDSLYSSVVIRDGRIISKFKGGDYSNQYVPLHQVMSENGYTDEFGPLPEFWSVDVADVMAKRESDRHRQRVMAAVGALDAPAVIKARLQADVAAGICCRVPEIKDLRFFCESAKRTTDQYGKARPAYTPPADCKLTLKLSRAVLASYSQEAYADMSAYYVPVGGNVTSADYNACIRNLNAFVRYANTHTGWAGSGCSYSADLVIEGDAAYAVITCRASIAD